MKYLLILLVSSLFFALTYASAPTEFPFIDLFFIFCLASVFLVLECSIVWLVSTWRILQNLLFACFITINILSLNLILNETYVAFPVYLQGATLIVAALIFYLFGNIVDTNRSNARMLLWLYVIAIAGVLVQARLAVPPVPELVAAEGKTSASNLKLVKFKEKPNVYFISFDSLLPRSIMRKHLDMATTPYHEILDREFRRFPNFFADYPNTFLSLNSVLALDTEHFSRAVENKTELYFFPGLVPSPLLEIFKSNGYETTTSYQSLHMGHTKGSHVDSYRVNRWDLRAGACRFIQTGGIKAITLAGYCYLLDRSILQRAFMKAEGTLEQNEVDFLLQYMREGLRRDAPQLFVSYIYSPGHTWFGFDFSDASKVMKFQNYYQEASKTTAEYLEKITRFTLEEDPRAIVYIFGDHGPHMARRASLEEDPVFLVQDSLAVYGGIHPPDRCAETFDNPYNTNFMTVSQGALMIIRCLSGGEDAYIKKREYRLPDDFVTGGKDRYEDYIYE
jgi:hypothetical protein